MPDIFQGENKDTDFSLISSGLHAQISGASTKRVQIGDITSKLVEGDRMQEKKVKQERRGKKLREDRINRKHKNITE